tara:strand:+ start:1557 stop:1778 length:222 start_codon:yes stop_codon:yes gene_type:complete
MKITRKQLQLMIKEAFINEQPSPPPMDGPLENLASDILDMMENAVGQIDLNFSDDPMTYAEIKDFVIRMVQES